MNETTQVTEEELLSSARVAMCEAVEWYANCLEYGRGIEGAVWVRPDSKLDSLYAMIQAA